MSVGTLLLRPDVFKYDKLRGCSLANWQTGLLGYHPLFSLDWLQTLQTEMAVEWCVS